MVIDVINIRIFEAWHAPHDVPNNDILVYYHNVYNFKRLTFIHGDIIIKYMEQLIMPNGYLIISFWVMLCPSLCAVMEKFSLSFDKKELVQL